jgi:hypothetical protein
MVSPDGAFTIEQVPPGRYTLQAHTSSEYAAVPLQVSGEDITDVVVSTHPPGDIRGEISFDGGAPPDDLLPQAIEVRPISSDPALALVRGRSVVKDDWTFEILGVMAWGRIGVRAPAPWYVGAVLVDNRDVTDVPLDLSSDLQGKRVRVVLTRQTTRVSGLVVDDRGRPAAVGHVVVFADERDKWSADSRFIASTRPDEKASFVIERLPPGRYIAAAVVGLEPGEERNAEALERMRLAGTTFDLTVNEAKAFTLRIATLR